MNDKNRVFDQWASNEQIYSALMALQNDFLVLN